MTNRRHAVRLGHAPGQVLARLVNGEWLQREARRIDARKELRASYELFSDFGKLDVTSRTQLANKVR